MSAPHSIGRHRYGVAKVLSTTRGSSCSCAIDARASMSSTLPPGLPIVSPKNAFVFGWTAWRHASGSSGSTQVTSMLSLRSRCLNWFTVPPYSAVRGDDVVTGLQQREQRGGLRSEPARERHGTGAALEVRHPLLEDRDGRVHDPRVGVAVLLQVEVRRRRLGVLEHIAGRLEDRHRPGARVRVRSLPGVQLAGLEPEVVVLLGASGLVGHLGLFRGVIRRPVSGTACGQELADQWGLSCFLEQEAVVTVRRVDHVQLDRLAESAQRVVDLPRCRRRVEPVGAERDQQRARRDAFERPGERTTAVLPGEVEVRQRARGVEVGVGVEPLDERVGLVVEVALDLELGLGDRVADVVGGLQPPAELVVQRRCGQVRDVADHARHAHAGVGRAPRVVVVAALPGGVAHDRLACDRVPGHPLRVEGVRAGDRDDGVDLLGKQDRPLERLHAAERATGHGRESLDAEDVEERALRAHHVGDRDHREVRAVRRAGRRVDGRRAPSTLGTRRAGSWRPRRSGRCRTPCRGRSSRPTSRAPCRPYRRAPRPRTRRGCSRRSASPRSRPRGRRR